MKTDSLSSRFLDEATNQRSSRFLREATGEVSYPSVTCENKAPLAEFN
jgi:hypothetical protein